MLRNFLRPLQQQQRRAYGLVTPVELANKLLAGGTRVIDLRLPSEKTVAGPIPGAVAFPVRKQIEDKLDAQRRALQLLRSGGKRKKKKAANQQQQQQKLAELQSVTNTRPDFWGDALKWEGERFKSRLGFDKPTADDELVFVAGGTDRAVELATQAEKHGFKRVFILQGGARLWHKYY